MSEDRRANLIKVRNYLASNSPPPNFDMSTWMRYGEGHHMTSSFPGMQAYNECGTSACVVGHGPLAGVGILPYESWYAYAKRCFTDDPRDFEWLFGSDWSAYDNSVEGAIKRIDIWLDGGTPGGFKYPNPHWVEEYNA